MPKRKGGAEQTPVGAFFEGLAPSVQQLLMANNLDLSVLRSNAGLLRKEEFERLDTALVRVAQERLNGIADLRTAGLIRNLGSLGVLIDQFEQVSEFTAASQDMDVITEGDEDTAAFTLNSVPIPITHKSFRVSLRHLEASRTIGAPIDTTNIELATRQVVEKLEDTLFNGGDVVVGGNSIFGYTNHPDRNTGALVAPWTSVGTRDIIRDVINMVKALEGDAMFGPYMFYVPIAFWSELKDDYKADSERTFLERIRAIDPITDIKPTKALTGSIAVAVQLTSDVVDLSIGADIQTVEWQAMGGLLTRFKVLTAQAPRVKSDALGQSGVVVFT